VTAEQAERQADLVAFFLHCDHEDQEQGPYGPGETASVYRATREHTD
jgi:hypothetical protein